MTPLVLAGIILASTLVAALGYLSKSQERQDTLRAQQLGKYKERIRKLDNMIFGLPPNYLQKTLKVLIYASIIDSLKHLNQLSGSKNLDEQIVRVKQTLDDLLKKDAREDTGTPEISYSELKECKYLLIDLHTLILDFHN
ncbi:MAG: hypothetical protein GKR91_01040 [Pseudomonadales bacterium]|nr:hypothetical protein [Pseudomonadales bacterium]